MRRKPGQHHPDGHPERRFDKAQQAVHPGRQGVAALRDKQNGQQRDGRHASVIGDAEQHAQHDEQRHGEHHAERREGEEAQIGIGKQRPERRAGHAQQPRTQRLPESRRLEHHHGRGAGQHGPHAARCLVEGARDEGADKVGHHHPDAARHHHHGANPPQQSMYRRFHALRCPFWGSMQQETGRSRRERRTAGTAAGREGKQSARRRAANTHAARTQKNRAAGCTLQPTARSLFHGYTAAPTHRRGGRCPQVYIQRVSIIVGLLEPP